MGIREAGLENDLRLDIRLYVSLETVLRLTDRSEGWMGRAAFIGSQVNAITLAAPYSSPSQRYAWL